MILPGILIGILSVFVFYCINNMIKHGQDLHAMAFFTLYIYTIFAQIGYAYIPELSMTLSAYFGAELFYKYWTFIFLSFISTYILHEYLFSKPHRISYKIYYRNNFKTQNIFLFIIVIFLTLLFVYFTINKGNIQYGDGNALGSLWFAFFFRIYITLTLILYFLFREGGIGKIRKRFILALFLVSIFLIFNVAFTSGARSDILFFFLGVAAYELFPLKKTLKENKKKIFFIIIISVLLVKLLSGVLALRTNTNEISFANAFMADDSGQDDTFISKLIFQDYFAPSHTLFISMNYHLVDFFDTVKSNLSNALFGFNYPLITQKIVSNVIDVDFDDRGIGYAYYLFVEGYNAMGWFGIIYNAIIWNLGITLWLWFTRSNDNKFNKMVMAIVASFIIGLMRNQSSYFIKFLWMNLIPAMVLLILGTNASVFFFKRRKNE